MEQLLNTSQVARLSARSRNTIAAWVKSGRLPSQQRQGIAYVSLTDFMQAFPYVEPERIEQELAGAPTRATDTTTPPAKYHAQQTEKPAQHAQQAQHDNTQELLIQSLQAQLEAQKEIIAMLNKQIAALTKDKEEMWGMLSQLTGRLLTAPKSSTAAKQARDDKGKFTKTGRGTDALFQGSLVDDSAPTSPTTQQED